MPMDWTDAVEQFIADTIVQHGLNPGDVWTVIETMGATKAMEEANKERVTDTPESLLPGDMIEIDGVRWIIHGSRGYTVHDLSLVDLAVYRAGMPIPKPGGFTYFTLDRGSPVTVIERAPF